MGQILDKPIICPNCRCLNISKYETCEQVYKQLEDPLNENVWFLHKPAFTENKRTPENDYYKCEVCGLTWRTRK
jgi:hypothetical protein